MKTLYPLTLLCVLATPGPVAFAQDASAARVGTPTAQIQSRAPQVRIAPAAKDAVMVVNNFMAALSAGNFAAAREFLDPGVVVITNGSMRASRDEYMAQQSKADAGYLQKAQRQMLRRDARAGANFAWVISEKLFRMQGGDKASALVTSETMLLAKADAGWKIVHIHWSSRLAPNR
ncbi:MAG: nuclear transport factor 2 family protein [Luteimonas sp.]